ncbi:DUF1761 domain-containing protein [Actibacterium lipolyticum]|uniref:DUF1761 domain-containing protein n=1 Tax=Actibacterium lipolyticum TaxID=1524263 RepID=A0A238KWL9_9RHOB|nr:DUF1761 domain-containing protein [Actibacterium lipolyticum]SMX47203.1 hypothetical protein COL8621_03368 [Actibacterium lipolyticum]
MDYLSVIIAAIASYAFGAVWYMKLARPWMQAAGIEADENGRPKNNAGAMPYIIAFVSAVIVAGMMRHIFALSGIDTLGAGIISGFGLGLFIATPWIATNYGFAGRPRMLTLIDGGYATIGCTIMGLVLSLF